VGWASGLATDRLRILAGNEPFANLDEDLTMGPSRLISPVDQSWDSFFEGPTASENFMTERHQPAAKKASRSDAYMLDTNICVSVTKNRPAQLRQRFNELGDQLCISVITLAKLIYGNPPLAAALRA
jgi:hypothetical protein